MFATADLYDAHRDAVQVAEPLFASFGGVETFGGPVETVRVYEDNVLVRQTLATDGQGRVLVVDGGGSTWCALMGDRLAGLAIENDWVGVIVFGCVRDTVELAGMDVGLLALAPCPRKSRKEGLGAVGVPVGFAGVTVQPGDYVYADPDGLLVAQTDLLAGGEAV
jgi:regulator of ribonuclease activity A